MMLCFLGSYTLSFTPRTMVMSSFLAGAEMMTFFDRPAQVLAGVLRFGKPAGRFDDDLRAHRIPIQLRRIFDGENLEVLLADAQIDPPRPLPLRQRAKHGIVFQKVSERLGIGDIVHRHEIDIGVMQTRADHIATDASETIDANFHSHVVD